MLTKFSVALAVLAHLSYAEDSIFDLRYLQEEDVLPDEPTPAPIPPYYERAECPDDVGWFKGSTYQGKSRH